HGQLRPPGHQQPPGARALQRQLAADGHPSRHAPLPADLPGDARARPLRRAVPQPVRLRMLSFVVLTLALLGALVTAGGYAITRLPSLPPSPAVLARVLELVDRVPRREVVDFGSGYGTLVLAVARRCPRASVTGYEVSPIPFLISRLRLAFARLPNARIRF